MGNMNGSYGDHYTLWQSITVNSQSIANKTSNVTVRLYLKFDGSSYYAYTNDSTSGEMKANRWEDSTYVSVGTYSIDSIAFSSGQAKDVLLAQWTDNITHNADGTKVLKVTGTWNTDTSRIGSGSCSASLTLPAIARKGVLKINSVSNVTLNTAKVNYTHTSGLFTHVQYSLDGGTWQNGSGYPTMTISGLSPNTSYNVRVRALNPDKTIIGDASNSVSFTTLDIGRITNFPIFDHGNNASITITNPSRC